MTILDRAFARLLAISLSIALLAAWLAACSGDTGTRIRVSHAAGGACFDLNKRKPT